MARACSLAMLDCMVFNLSPGSLSWARSRNSAGINTFASTFNKRDFFLLLRKHEASPKLKAKKTKVVMSSYHER